MSRLPFGRDPRMDGRRIAGDRHRRTGRTALQPAPEGRPTPEEYLSLSTLATEYIHYLADRPQTARETLSLILEISSLFEKHWQETCCFQSENLYTPAINSLLDSWTETERGMRSR